MAERIKVLNAALKALMAGAEASAIIKIPVAFISELASLSSEKVNTLNTISTEKLNDLLTQSELSTSNAALAAVGSEQIKLLITNLTQLSTEQLNSLQELTQEQYQRVLKELYLINSNITLAVSNTEDIKAQINKLTQIIDKQPNERQDLVSIFETKTLNRIKAEKHSKKYIPDIFVEIDEIKDKARMFCEPELFINKIVDNICDLNFIWINNALKQVGLQEFILGNDSLCQLSCHYSGLQKDVEVIGKELLRITTAFSRFTDKDFIESQVDESKQHILEEIGWRIRDTSHYFLDFEIGSIQKMLKTVLAQVMIITSRAGQGKTNFVCNLAESFLLKKGIPCLYYTGKELASLAPNNNLGPFFIQSTYGNADRTLKQYLDDLNTILIKNDVPLIILIDAINEHSNMYSFSVALEQFIEQCVEYPNIKILLTCRSEYFDARFNNLLHSSFSDKLIFEEDIFKKMDEFPKDRLLEGYLNYFHINNSIYSRLSRILKNDPLLLRMFCEAYGDSLGSETIRITCQQSINRNHIVEKYLNTKLTEVTKKHLSETGNLLGNKYPYQNIIRLIIEWMLDNKCFENVPINIFKKQDLGTLSDLLGEDIIVRKDIVNSNISSIETVNFTYDFVRDFLITNYLTNEVVFKDKGKFDIIIEEITKPDYVVAEGLQEALFFASRHNHQVEKIIKQKSWYENTFLTYVFDLANDEIHDTEIEQIKNKCMGLTSMSQHIVSSLITRYNVQQYTKLNIQVLFDIFDSMDDGSFQRIIEMTFLPQRSHYREAYYPIDELTDQIGDLLLCKTENWDSAYIPLATLLLYLWEADGDDYNMPAQILFSKFYKLRPLIAKELCIEHIGQNRKGFNQYDYNYLTDEYAE